MSNCCIFVVTYFIIECFVKSLIGYSWAVFAAHIFLGLRELGGASAVGTLRRLTLKGLAANPLTALRLRNHARLCRSGKGGGGAVAPLCGAAAEVAASDGPPGPVAAPSSS